MAESRKDGSLTLVKRIGTRLSRKEIYDNIRESDGWARVHEVEERDGYTCVIRDWVSGLPLTRLLGKNTLTWQEAAFRYLFTEICRFLSDLHGAGVGHGQIRPGNILLSPVGVKLTDPFPGETLDFNSDARLTHLSLLVGDPHFLAPEQFRGKVINLESDVYALGCLMYYALAGFPPFRGGNPVLICSQHLSIKPQSLAELRPDVSPTLLDIIDKTLAKVPEHRYPSAMALAEAIAQSEGGAGERADFHYFLREAGQAETLELDDEPEAGEETAHTASTNPSGPMAAELCKTTLLSREELQTAFQAAKEQKSKESLVEALANQASTIEEFRESIRGVEDSAASGEAAPRQDEDEEPRSLLDDITTPAASDDEKNAGQENEGDVREEAEGESSPEEPHDPPALQENSGSPAGKTRELLTKDETASADDPDVDPDESEDEGEPSPETPGAPPPLTASHPPIAEEQSPAVEQSTPKAQEDTGTGGVPMEEAPADLQDQQGLEAESSTPQPAPLDTTIRPAPSANQAQQTASVAASSLSREVVASPGRDAEVFKQLVDEMALTRRTVRLFSIVLILILLLLLAQLGAALFM